MDGMDNPMARSNRFQRSAPKAEAVGKCRMQPAIAAPHNSSANMASAVSSATTNPIKPALSPRAMATIMFRKRAGNAASPSGICALQNSANDERQCQRTDTRNQQYDLQNQRRLGIQFREPPGRDGSAEDQNGANDCVSDGRHQYRARNDSAFLKHLRYGHFSHRSMLPSTRFRG